MLTANNAMLYLNAVLTLDTAGALAWTTSPLTIAAQTVCVNPVCNN
jgi:hypothetical protein